LAAYISAGSGVFQEILAAAHVQPPTGFSAILFVAVFGYIVYRGIQPVDYVNRGLMTIKLGTLFILIFSAFPYIDLHKLSGGNPRLLAPTVTVMLTSFGFATIIPSLRSYFNDDIKKLRLTILIGSLIPLTCYLLWDFAILGTLPREGNNGLLEIMQQGGSAIELTRSLSYYLNNTSITAFSHIFTAICVLTSFLGVSLGLSDFLADGLRLEKIGNRNWKVAFITFLPPLAIVLIDPNIFIKALSYAGTFCVVLVILLPALMTFSGRYYKKLAVGHYQVAGGKIALILTIVIALGIIGRSFFKFFIS
ncbi:MAG TPA: aromatic amino acid transport family protein, partial [Gammaproteobacteria bacterium]|nr:aromatic amino acid transport family protein [Gammaproteobacteria bacterium]